jgi:hypothetical protein
MEITAYPAAPHADGIVALKLRATHRQRTYDNKKQHPCHPK